MLKCVDASPLVVSRNGRVLALIGSHGGDFSCFDLLSRQVRGLMS